MNKRDGLYYLLPNSRFFTLNNSILEQQILAFHISSSQFSCGLWHARFGHLAHDKLAVLNKVVSYIDFSDNKSSNICPLAKQRHGAFPTSYIASFGLLI